MGVCSTCSAPVEGESEDLKCPNCSDGTETPTEMPAAETPAEEVPPMV